MSSIDSKIPRRTTCGDHVHDCPQLAEEMDAFRAEVKRLSEWNARLISQATIAEEKWRQAEAEVERLRAALKALLDYTVQVEQLAYDVDEQIIKHPIVLLAEAALRGVK